MSAAEKEVRKELDKISDFYDNRLVLAESKRNIFHATVEPNVTREHLVDPAFWKHVAQKLQPYTRIEVVTDDGKYFCELLVLNSGKNWAITKELRYIELGGHDIAIRQASLMDEYVYKWRGPHQMHCIVRKSDNEVIKEGMQTQEEARRFLSEYIKVITA